MRNSELAVLGTEPSNGIWNFLRQEYGNSVLRLVLFIGILCCIPTASAQWSNSYSYRGVITVAHTSVPNTDQVNFPVLVSGTYPDLAAASGKVTNANGYDIIFTSDANGLNKLNFERE